MKLYYFYVKFRTIYLPERLSKLPECINFHKNSHITLKFPMIYQTPDKYISSNA